MDHVDDRFVSPRGCIGPLTSPASIMHLNNLDKTGGCGGLSIDVLGIFLLHKPTRLPDLPGYLALTIHCLSDATMS